MKATEDVIREYSSFANATEALAWLRGPGIPMPNRPGERAGLDGPECGRVSTYVNQRCRCEACREAWRRYRRMRRTGVWSGS